MTHVTRRELLLAASVLGGLGIGVRASFAAELSPAAGQGHRESQTSALTTTACDVRLFDLLAYTDKPDLRSRGIEPIRIFSAQHLWGDRENRDSAPAVASVSRGLKHEPANGGPVVLDIEHWPFRGKDAEVTATVDRLLTLLARVRAQEPEAAVGFYSIPPIRDYWRAVSAPGAPEHTQWNRENDHFKSVAQAVDILYPSLYTFYDDVEGWRRYAIANLAEARRLAGSRRVYPFLWPQFHNSNRTRGGQYLDASFWRTQLEVAAAHADGIVLWGGWGAEGRMRWDDSAPWWRATQQFMANRGSHACP